MSRGKQIFLKNVERRRKDLGEGKGRKRIKNLKKDRKSVDDKARVWLNIYVVENLGV